MDMPGNDTNVEPPKRSEEIANYHALNISSDWHVTGNNTTNTSIGMIPMGNPMVESSSCSSMVDSFCPPIWDQPINGTNRMSNAVLRENMFLSTVPTMFPPSLSHFPTDSGFIERAARFSCFNGGHLSQMVNPFSILDTLNLNSHLGLMQRPNEAFVGNGLKAPEIFKEDLLIGERGTEGNSFKNEKKSEIFTDEVKIGVDVLGTQSDEAAGSSGRDPQEEFDGTAGEFSGKGICFKKRKRAEQKTVNNENNEAQQPALTGNPGGKGSDPPKEEYIHVRARRGQATNSHSLAERIRREKIGERMKFLQDLVPGCSKVTGKAVMLDEIINYVQSLQRQVEFLSMKLATVNPRLDFNMEGFLAKDILQTRAGLSASLGFPPDMTMPFPPIQPGLIQTGFPGLGNSPETLRRPISLQSNVVCGGLREPIPSQTPSVWDDELHNVVHNGFNLSAPLNSSGFKWY